MADNLLTNKTECLIHKFLARFMIHSLDQTHIDYTNFEKLQAGSVQNH